MQRLAFGVMVHTLQCLPNVLTVRTLWFLSNVSALLYMWSNTEFLSLKSKQNSKGRQQTGVDQTNLTNYNNMVANLKPPSPKHW